MLSDYKNIDISIVIVNYKSWKFLDQCLQSLREIKFNSITHEVIIVDNYSNDNKLEDFKKRFTEYKFYENSGNNGFANACNLGAEKSVGEYLLFLNPDTLAFKEPIEKMYNYLKANNNCGLVSCLQKNDNNSFEKSYRYFPSFKTLFGLLRAINKAKLKKEITQEDNILFPDWISGAVVFISRQWFKKIDGWDEDYWMYYEDVDLSKKVSDLGGKVALLTDTSIIHNHGGASRLNINTARITKTEVLISKHIYISKYFKGFERFLLQALIIVNNVIGKLVLALIGLVFFFVPKLRLQLYLFLSLIKYYFYAIFNNSWISKRSINHPTKFNYGN